MDASSRIWAGEFAGFLNLIGNVIIIFFERLRLSAGLRLRKHGEFHCAPAKSRDNGGASERSSAWLERVVWVHEVAGSNPVAPTIFSSFAETRTAGEKFFAWIKSCKQKLPARCLQKIIVPKTIVKSGENALRRKTFSGWHRRC